MFDLSGKKALITGITGMVGSHLADYLLENTDWIIPSEGSTFHARDIFSPFAAGYASGQLPLEEFGPEVDLGDERRLIASVSKALLEGYNLKRSGGEIRQLITQGAVQLDGEKFDDVKGNLPQDVKGKLLRLDKKRSVRFL